jgi:hypothetical protein
MQAKSIIITKNYIIVLTNEGLDCLRNILGTGIGVGMEKSRPTKMRPYIPWTIGSSITAVELQETLPEELTIKPLLPWPGNSIDLIYSEESSQLSCYICHTKVVTSTVDVVTSHLHRAEVHGQLLAGSCVNAIFLYNNELMTVTNINRNVVTCHHLTDDSDDGTYDEGDVINLPIETVSNLIASFGC